MLVLSRRLNESILIDGDTRITVLGIRGNQVRLGIEAPGHIKLMRAELVEQARPAAEPAPAGAAEAPGSDGRPRHAAPLSRVVRA
jgi:carbon storage regulator